MTLKAYTGISKIYFTLLNKQIPTSHLLPTIFAEKNKNHTTAQEETAVTLW